MEKFMGGEEQEKKENSGYGERLREITAVLKKHAITRGVSPEKLRLILEDLGPTYISWVRLCPCVPIFFPRDTVMS